MYELAERLFPICRSITGDGVRQTLEILKEEYEDLQVYEVPSGTQVFDWTVPKEWNIRDAYIEDSQGKRIIDFKESNLYVMGYSLPMDRMMSLEELKQMIFTQPEQPDVIPYVTSYYQERSGFCMSENQKNALREDTYHCVIDSDLKEGSLTYGEIILKGDTEEEVLLSTYICHPSMANNEVSGPVVTIELVKWLASLKQRRYTYRILFIPETIGSITYLSRNLETMKKNTTAGFVLSCLGDDRTYSIVETKYGGTLTDRLLKNILQFHFPDYICYDFLHRGSDERQYNAPGVDLPVCGVCRSKYEEYPEYHTSADDLSLISEEGLQGSAALMKKCIMALEYNYFYKLSCCCEPQLGKRGLYPTLSQKGNYSDAALVMRDLVAYADGSIDLIEISNRIRTPIDLLIPLIDKLLENGLFGIVE
jgi:aminopeptidase-like protein